MHAHQKVVQKEIPSAASQDRYQEELQLGRLPEKTGANVSSLRKAPECPSGDGEVASSPLIPNWCLYLRVCSAAGRAHGAYEPHALWAYRASSVARGENSPKTWKNCRETSERKSWTHSYDDLVDLSIELATERENDTHMDKYLRKHL